MTKEKIAFINKIIIFILTFIIIIGLYLDYKNESIVFLANSSSILILFLGISLYMLFKYVYFNIKEKRLKVCTTILAIIFSILYYLGELGNKYSQSIIPINYKFLFYSILKIIAFYIVFKNILALLFYKANKYKHMYIKSRYLNDDKKSFLTIAIIFFVSYIPFFLHYYPGAIQYDAINSLEQVLGITFLHNHHPVPCTLYLGFFFKLGLEVFKKANIGIGLYTISHMIIGSLTLSYLLYYLAKRKVDYKFRLVTFLVLLLNPLHGFFAIRIEKSYFFHMFLLIFVTLLIDIFYEKDKFFKNKKKCILTSILILVISLIRHNGIYIFLLTFICMLFFDKRIWKKSIIVFIAPIICYYIYNGPILTKLDVKKDDSTKEMLSIPLQQQSRIIKYDKETLKKSEYKSIHKYIELTDEEISEKYNPLISDNIKYSIRSKIVNKYKEKIISNYLRLSVKYPEHTFSAFLFNTYGYYSPISTNIWGIHNYGMEAKSVLNSKVYYDKNKTKKNLDDETNKEIFKIYPRHIIYNMAIEKINNLISEKNIPILSVTIFSIGFYFFVLLFCIVYFIYRKCYHELVIFLPMVFLWLTSIAGPVVDWRYIYSFMICMPLYVGIVFFSRKFGGVKK